MRRWQALVAVVGLVVGATGVLGLWGLEGAPAPGRAAADAGAMAEAEAEGGVVASARAAVATANEGGTPRPCAVAAVGDSLTDARSGGGKYLQVLRERFPGSRFDNHGRGGELVNQMRARFARDVLQARVRYSHVIVFGGVNDIGSDDTAGRTLDAVRQDLRAMYAIAHANGIQVVAVTLSPWGGFQAFYNSRRRDATLALNTWIRKAPEGHEADAVVDAYELLSCGDPERLCPAYVAPFDDGLHFNADGHRRLGEALAATAFRGCR